ncbi:MAG: tetratricopeptide repeat protein [Candidatus Eisenbacteria bacterium]
MALEHQHKTHLDDDARLIQRVTALWEQYGRTVLGVIGVVAVVLVGTYFYRRTRETQENAAAGKLAEASVLYWQGDYSRSQDLAKQVSTQYPGTASGLEAHRMLGDDAFWSGDFKTAVAEYRRYLDKAPKGLLADAGRRSYAYALESDGQYAEAGTTYLALVGRFDRISSAEFLVAAARCERLQGHDAEALKLLQRADSEFGETTYARNARVEIAELKAKLGS